MVRLHVNDQVGPLMWYCLDVLILVKLTVGLVHNANNDKTEALVALQEHV